MYTGVYVCLVIPGLVVGTVGGGTQLATQKECLSMMGCFGKVTFNSTGICNTSAHELQYVMTQQCICILYLTMSNMMQYSYQEKDVCGRKVTQEHKITSNVL